MCVCICYVIEIISKLIFKFNFNLAPTKTEEFPTVFDLILLLLFLLFLINNF